MRADRLVSLLMLLQTRGRLTARVLASELEVSERTIYRDVEALSVAGVPIYGEPGPAGGYALIDSYRTTLTGLTEGEVRALFMLGIPQPLSQLGVAREAQTALLKLTAALPAIQQRTGDLIRQRVHLDPAWWPRSEESVPHLQTVHQAVLQDRRLVIRIHLPAGTVVEQAVEPYGLVSKAGTWYLLYAHHEWMDARRVSELLDVRLAEQGFERAPGFDLAAVWQKWCAAHEADRPRYAVTLRISPEFLPALPRLLGRALDDMLVHAGASDTHGWMVVELAFDSLDEARERLLACGRGVEILEPRALRQSVLDYAQQIAALYASRAS